jgi:hypothetical protein
MIKIDNRMRRTEDLEEKKAKYQFYLKNMTEEINQENMKAKKQEISNAQNDK